MSASPCIERRTKAMGTSVHIVLTGADSIQLDSLVSHLEMLESKWSRFIDSSEISRVNAAPDDMHVVSPETAELVDRAVQAWALSNGAFDPTVLPSLLDNGYSKSFDRLPAVALSNPTTSAPGCADIYVDLANNLVRLGQGVGFDPGGIGKGLAADMLVRLAMRSGASGAMVNIGGDIVCDGLGPHADEWLIEVFEPSVCDTALGVISLRSGAVATSTTQKRRWNTDQGPRHHVIDPSTGNPTSGPVLATVVASEGWYAEVIAKQLLVGGVDTAIDTTNAAALIIDDAGEKHVIGKLKEYLR